ncbi:hypothetical protein [Maridesulfovibrio sp.]|uniref:hypothetical protein n=1 Tax=Maridesulfovibrio sp. TaxID=2795000 RepID=UPI003AFFAE9F
MKKHLLEIMAKSTKSSIVSRVEASEMTGKMISPATLRNLDSLGKGPKVRVRMGRKVGYSVSSFIEWCSEHLEVC